MTGFNKADFGRKPIFKSAKKQEAQRDFPILMPCCPSWPGRVASHHQHLSLICQALQVNIRRMTSDHSVKLEQKEQNKGRQDKDTHHVRSAFFVKTFRSKINTSSATIAGPYFLPRFQVRVQTTYSSRYCSYIHIPTLYFMFMSSFSVENILHIQPHRQATKCYTQCNDTPRLLITHASHKT